MQARVQKEIGARAERTSNITMKPWLELMLDVSKLSGWLNTSVICQVEREDTKRARRRGSGEVVR